MNLECRTSDARSNPEAGCAITARVKWTAHLLAIAATAILLGVCFLQEPLLSDDLTYWSFALDLHEHGLRAWNALSFYDLRWPVWGMCWLLQGIFSAGLVSYWGVPLLYFAAGAALTFAIARRLTGSILAAWLCGIVFLFHPFLDDGASAPMPDLSEAFWSAATILAWWSLVQATKATRILVCAVLTGVCVVILEANRVTGVFILPVLVASTAFFFPRRFARLIIAGLVALLAYAGECAFYHHLFGDWLHDLSANTLNRGTKATELAQPWILPVRFLDSFCESPLICAYSLCACVGIWFAWCSRDALARVLVLWFAIVLFEYSCAPQSLSPIRPLVRDAARFLSAVAVPMSLLAVTGVLGLVALVRRKQIGPRVLLSSPPGPARAIALGGVVITMLVLATERDFFDPGFVPELRAHFASLPNGAAIFTHSSMRDLVRLVDAEDASRVRWLIAGDLLQHDSALEAQAEKADELCYVRKLAWLNARRKLERGEQIVTASYLASPERWALSKVMLKGNTPDLVIYRKRTPAASSPEILDSDAPELQSTATPLPMTWERARDPRRVKSIWKIPERFRGRLVRLELEAAADEVEAFVARLRFTPKEHDGDEPIVLHPYLSTRGGMDQFALQIPATSTACEIRLRFSAKVRRVEFTRFRAVLENAR